MPGLHGTVPCANSPPGPPVLPRSDAQIANPPESIGKAGAQGMERLVDLPGRALPGPDPRAEINRQGFRLNPGTVGPLSRVELRAGAGVLALPAGWRSEFSGGLLGSHQ